MKAVLQTLVIALVVLGLFIGPSVSLAQQTDTAIVVTSNTYQNSFPDKIVFNLKAESGTKITKVKFNYRIVGDPSTTYGYPEGFTPGNQVVTTYEINLQKDYLPPQVELRYYWDLEDAAGHQLQTEPTTFAVNDTRFPWRQVEQGQVIVFWYQGGDSFAQSVLEMANTALAKLSQEEGINPQDKVKILAYTSYADLLGALGPSAKEWTGGVSFSEQSIIALGIPSTSEQSSTARLLAHELTHVVLYQATDNPYGDIPRWLNEGLAMYNEGELEEQFRQPLSSAIQQNKLWSLQSMSGDFPTDSDQAVLCYAESYSVVQYIIDQYGPEKMAALLKVFSQGSTYNDALQSALGVATMKDLETEWKASLGVAPVAAGAGSETGLPSDHQGKSMVTTATPASKSEPCGALPFSLVIAVGVVAVKRFRA